MLYGRRIAVVVPAFNEERFIARTIQTVPCFVDRVIVVDDACTDSTAATALSVADRRVSLVRHETNRGVGAAIVSGYREALAPRENAAPAEWVVVMAGDGQMDPADLKPLLRPLARNEADYVKGNRLDRPEVARVMPRVRFVGNWILTRLTRIACGYRNVTDSQCGYTAITRSALLSLPLDRVYPRYGYPIDMLSRLHLAGARVLDVTVRAIYEGQDSGIRLARDVPRILWLLARTLGRRILYRLRGAKSVSHAVRADT